MAWLRQEDADFSDPMQAFLWALAGVPVDKKGTQIAFPMHSAAYISKHLDECGFVFVPERQRKFRRAGDAISEMSPIGVEWVRGEPGEPPLAAETLERGVNLDAFTPAEIAQLKSAIGNWEANR